MDGALTSISDEGVLGAVAALSLFVSGYLFFTLQKLHAENRESDRKTLERMFEAVQALREATSFLRDSGRGQ